MSVAVAVSAVTATFFIFAAEIFVFYGYNNFYNSNSHCFVICRGSDDTQSQDPTGRGKSGTQDDVPSLHCRNCYVFRHDQRKGKSV